MRDKDIPRLTKADKVNNHKSRPALQGMLKGGLDEVKGYQLVT